MKRYLALGLTVALWAGLLAGCGEKDGSPTPTPAPDVSPGVTEPLPTPVPPDPTPTPASTPEPTPTPEETPPAGQEQGTAPTPVPTSTPTSTTALSPEEQKARQQAMLPLLDALVRCLNENGMDYEPREQEFFWVALCYALSEDGVNHPLVTAEEWRWSVQAPRRTVQEYASALFADYDDLLALPELMENSVWYNEEQDAYGFAVIEPPEETAALVSWRDRPGGGYEAELSLPGEGKTFRAELMDNPYADGITQPRFYYTVTALKEVGQSADQTDYTGVYTDKQGTAEVYSQLKLTRQQDGSYALVMGLHRLTTLEGRAAAGSGGLRFTCETPHVEGTIQIQGTAAEVTVTASSFDYIHAGDVFTFPDGAA